MALQMIPFEVVDSPGRSVIVPFAAGVQVIAERPASGSVIVTFVNVTLPVLVATNEYVMTSPTALNDVLSADFTSVIAGEATAGTMWVSVSVGG